jgi:hypothetical protein
MSPIAVRQPAEAGILQRPDALTPWIDCAGVSRRFFFLVRYMRALDFLFASIVIGLC